MYYFPMGEEYFTVGNNPGLGARRESYEGRGGGRGQGGSRGGVPTILKVSCRFLRLTTQYVFTLYDDNLKSSLEKFFGYYDLSL